MMSLTATPSGSAPFSNTRIRFCLRCRSVCVASAETRRHGMIRNRDVRLRPMEAAPLVGQAGKALRTRHLLHEVSVDVEQHAAIVVSLDDVLLPDLVVKCASSHAKPAKKAYAR